MATDAEWIFFLLLFWNANGKNVAMKIQLFISGDDNFFEPNFMNIIYHIYNEV